MKLLSQTFRAIKSQKLPQNSKLPSSSTTTTKRTTSLPQVTKSSWCVYLIVSTNTPIKTYVGVTTNFSRRLKQHNGIIKGGAKACRAGRPWICACIIRGFSDHSEACVFESKWKSLSRKIHQRKEDCLVNQNDESSLPLLQRRQRALDKVKDSLDCRHLDIDWQLTLS